MLYFKLLKCLTEAFEAHFPCKGTDLKGKALSNTYKESLYLYCTL